MIPLDSPRWGRLTQAYGSAETIPDLLRQLESLPTREEPWNSLWSALAHQGDVYTASFAAVPHVVRILASQLMAADFQFFQFPAWIEICRKKKSVPIPADLEADYLDALDRLPSLAAVVLSTQRGEGYVRCALAAIAVSSGHIELAEAILELDPDVLREFGNWLQNR